MYGITSGVLYPTSFLPFDLAVYLTTTLTFYILAHVLTFYLVFYLWRGRESWVARNRACVSVSVCVCLSVSVCVYVCVCVGPCVRDVSYLEALTWQVGKNKKMPCAKSQACGRFKARLYSRWRFQANSGMGMLYHLIALVTRQEESQQFISKSGVKASSFTA